MVGVGSCVSGMLVVIELWRGVRHTGSQLEGCVGSKCREFSYVVLGGEQV